jgi:hypothetical protein
MVFRHDDVWMVDVGGYIKPSSQLRASEPLPIHSSVCPYGAAMEFRRASATRPPTSGDELKTGGVTTNVMMI